MLENNTQWGTMSSREIQINSEFVLSNRKLYSPRSLKDKNANAPKNGAEDSSDALFKAGIRIDALN
jgi:hypothetical protein